MALRLEGAPGTGAEMWLNMQTSHDLWQARTGTGDVGSDRTGNERSAPNQCRIDTKRLADLDQTLVQSVQTSAMM